MSSCFSYRSSISGVFLRKSALKVCSKFTEEHPCQSAILIKLLCNVIEIALRHRCFPINMLHISRTHFSNNTSGRLLLQLESCNPQRIIQNLLRHLKRQCLLEKIVNNKNIWLRTTGLRNLFLKPLPGVEKFKKKQHGALILFFAPTKYLWLDTSQSLFSLRQTPI